MAQQPPAFVSDAASAQAHAGKQVAVRGTARDAKLGPAIVAGDTVVYCPDIGSWPAELRGKAVKALGRLEHSADFSAAGTEISAGTDGPVWVLHDCRIDPG
jgi:hypothetical protein